mgnify:FL=1
MIDITKLGFVKMSMFLIVLVTLSACDMQQEENSVKNEAPDDGIIESEKGSPETDLNFVHIEKIEN